MFKKKKYINKTTSQEIEEKGFSVYNYISMSELISTINKDYLETLNTINIPFAVISVIVGYISYEAKAYEYILYLFLGVYGLVFLYLTGKLFYRTYKFSLVSNIIYTNKGLVIGEDIFHYEEDSKLKDLLEEYKELFSEYLSKPSTLKRRIEVQRGRLLNKISTNYKVALEAGDKVDERLALGGFLFLTLYSASIFIFYFLGIAIGFIIFVVVLFFINMYFKINKSLELKTKTLVSEIDVELDDLEEIYQELNKKTSNYNDGEIFNLSKHIEKEYNSFYSKINKIIDKKDKLKTLIESSKYKNFIDFALFALYLKDQFNKPLVEMIELLETYKQKVQKQLEEATQAIEDINSKEKYQIETRIINLQTISKNIEKHLDQLNSSIL